MNNAKRGKVVSYNKWGYIFLIPFVVVYAVFQLIPMVSTFYNSFFENYRSGLTQIGPNFVGFKNFATLFTNGDLLMYTRNTMIMWILGFVPQIIVSLLLGAWFSDPSLRLKGQRFFKTVIYLPNLIMASAFSMLFFTLFADSGPINSILISMGIISGPFKFMSHVWSVRGLVAFMNFRREIADDDNEIIAVLCLADKGDNAVVIVVGVNPLEAVPVEIHLPKSAGIHIEFI